MSKRLQRLWAVGVALGCVAAGWGVGALAHSAVAGFFCSAALGLGALRLADSIKASRLSMRLSADTKAALPGETGAWGELCYQIDKALRRREQQTQIEQQRLTQFLAAIEASPIGVLLLDADHHITWCSRVAAEHLGLDAKRDLEQPVTNLVRAPAFVEHMLDAPSALAVSFPGPSGIRLSALVQSYGEGLKLVLTQDITERERAELMRRNFVANVSHEIRTPLTVLAGFVETMTQLQLSEAETKRVLALMGTQADRMQHLVADLLTLAQLEGSPRPPSDHWLSVGDLMRRVSADATALSGGRHQLHFDGGEHAQLAGTDAELYSALSNLVVNAVRYTPTGGRIDVTWSRQPDGGAAWQVRDTGIGIEKEHLPRLTERFYRVDGSRSRDTGGTGLGLSIVKHVVQRHGGEIDIQSEPGKGSTFRLLLPAARVRDAAPRATTSTGQRAAG